VVPMRSRGTSLAAALAALVLPALAAAQQTDWSKIEIKTRQVAGHVYMLYGVGGFAGGNIGVSVGPDGVVLVDDEFEPLVPKIEAALSGITDRPVRFVLNTHFHGDHTHGNKVFGLKSTIIAHDNVRKRIAEDGEFDSKPDTHAPPHALPLITFDQSVGVHLNGEEIRGIHFPAGHTDGDTVVYFSGSNVVHMGDDFFNGMYPFIDLEAGGSVKGYIAALEKVLPELPADVKIIPGHGPLSTAADLEKYYTMLVKTTDVVRRAIDSGRTLKQIQNEGLPPEWTDWGSGYITTSAWLETVYRSLAERPGKGS
jgi:cyclase